jgi:TRAP-type C4-dicarboxylate transport system substrate-binding protein
MLRSLKIMTLVAPMLGGMTLATIISFLTISPTAAQTDIKFSNVFLPSSSTWKIIEKHLNQVVSDTHDSVKFDVGFDNKFGKVTEVVEKVESNEIQMAYIVFSSKPSRFPSLGVIELPLIRRTAIAGTKALCELEAEGDFKHDFTGLKMLAEWALPTYAILVDSKKPISGPSDLRGLRIRAPGPTGGRALQKMGAVPVNLSVGDMGKGLASGLVQGVTYGLYASMVQSGFEGKMLIDQVTQIIDLGISGPAVGIFMSETYFNSLAPDVQQALERHLHSDCAMATEIATDRDVQEDLTKSALAKDGKHTVITFDKADINTLHDGLSDVYDEWAASIASKGVDGKAMIEKVRSIAAKYE